MYPRHMDGLERSHELGEFLKARRSQISPADVGLTDGGSRRRVPGLRREEVAQLSSISTQYYTRVEQGRLQASEPVLLSLAKVLRLDDAERDYMLQLAGKEKARRPRRAKSQQARPGLKRLLDGLTDIPAVILGRRMDILSWNPMAVALLTDFPSIPHDQLNYARLVFSHTDIRSRYVNWEIVARDCVAFLRMESAHHPDDPRLSKLIGDLSIQDHDFRQWWAGRSVAHRTSGLKKLRHPVVGELTLEWQSLTSGDDPDQQLVTWTAIPGTPDADALRILAAWHAPVPDSEDSYTP